MALPGTELANKVLKQTGLMSRLYRNYTQKRVNDRTYKMYGRFSDSEAATVIAALTKNGALNARVVKNRATFWTSGGIRFELAN